jgi:hypothetical protein
MGVRARQAVAVALTDHEQAVLDLERSWWTEDGAKEVLIEERLGLTATRYYQVLNEPLDPPAARAHPPVVGPRLRRLRDRKRRARLDAAAADHVGVER